MNESLKVNNKGCKFRKVKGITLISLVITIIILVILSSIGIYLSIGNNGLVPKAQEAEEKTTKEVATEKMNLKITNRQIEIYTKEERMPTLQEFADGLCEDDEIEYVELKSKKRGSLDKISVGENEFIYTKLKEYPYEFEIDSSLRLASINGIKVASAGDNDVLFEGTTTEGCEISLKKQLSAYSYIDIYSRNIDNDSEKYPNPILRFYVGDIIANNKFFVNSICWNWSYSAEYSYNSTKNSLKNDENYTFGANGQTQGNYYAIEIYKIVGIK